MRLKHINFGKERLDTHHRAILDFIQNNPSQTENQIVMAMQEKKICSKMTTLKKLDELVEMQEIKDLLKKGESRFHKFIINDENEFNRINAELSKIESIVTKMENNVQILEKRDRLVKAGKELRYNRFQAVRAQFFFPYSESFNIMLRILLFRVNTKVHSDKDSQILYAKIVRLMLKMTQFGYEINEMTHRLRVNVLNLRNIYIYDEVKTRAKDYGIDINFRSNLITKIEYFMKEFLDDDLTRH